MFEMQYFANCIERGAIGLSFIKRCQSKADVTEPAFSAPVQNNRHCTGPTSVLQVGTAKVLHFHNGTFSLKHFDIIMVAAGAKLSIYNNS